MQIAELVIATPYYVLMNQKTPLGPDAADPVSDIAWKAVFGFSDKALYDHFCTESPLSLAPYPLVKGYLRNQIATSDSNSALERCVKLVVLDAKGPRDPTLHAATMQEVLEAQQNATAHIMPTHQLTFNVETHAYYLVEAPLQRRHS